MEEQATYDLFMKNRNASVPQSYFFDDPIYAVPADVPPDNALSVGTNIDQLGPAPVGAGHQPSAASGSYRAMSGGSMGQTGDHYWDNPQMANVSQNDMPHPWRGALHVIRETGGSRQFEAESMKDITDGTSNTLMVGEYHTLTVNGETASRRTFWAYGYTS